MRSKGKELRGREGRWGERVGVDGKGVKERKGKKKKKTLELKKQKQQS